MAKKKLFSGVKNFVKNTEYVKEQKPKTVSLGSSLQNTYKSSEPVQRQLSERERAEKERSSKMRSSALVSIAKTMAKNNVTKKTTLPSVAAKMREQSKAQAPKTSVSKSMAHNALAPVKNYASTHKVTGGQGVGNYGFKTNVKQKALPAAKEVAEYTRKQQNKYVYTPNNDYRFDAKGNMLMKKDPISIEYGKKLRAGMPSASNVLMSIRSKPTERELGYRQQYGFDKAFQQKQIEERLDNSGVNREKVPLPKRVQAMHGSEDLTPVKGLTPLTLDDFRAGFADQFAVKNPEDTAKKQFGLNIDDDTIAKLEAQRQTGGYAAGMLTGQAAQYLATRGLLGKAGLVGKSADAISDANKVVRVLESRGVKTGTAKAITSFMQEMGIDQAASVPLNLVDAMKADGGANIIKRFGINQGLDVLFSGLFEIPSLRRNMHFLNGNEINEAANAMQEGTEKLTTKIGAKRELDTAVGETGDIARQEAVEISNAGYHAGDLGKAESYFNQASSNRGTGHYGTGTYFGGRRDMFEGSSAYGNRPEWEVDFDGYNLYKPSGFDQGVRVHDNLAAIDKRGAKGLLNDIQLADDELFINKVLDKAQEGVTPSNIKSKLSAVEDTAKKYLPEYRIDEIEQSARDAYEYELARATDENYLQNRENDIRRTLSEIYSEDEIDDAMILDLIESEEPPTLPNLDEFRLNYYVDELRKELEGRVPFGRTSLAENMENAQVAVKQLAQDLGVTEDEVLDAIRKSADKVEKEYPSVSQSSGRKDLDSEATLFMKNLGYDGVDVRGIEGLDNTQYGSVIYDLKPETRRQQIREGKPREKASAKPKQESKPAGEVKEEQPAKVEEPKYEAKREEPKAKEIKPSSEKEPSESIMDSFFKREEPKAEPSSAWDEIENEIDNIPTKEPANKLKNATGTSKTPNGVERLDSETQEAIEKSKRMTQKEKEASKKAGDYPSGMPKEMNGQPLNKGFDSITRESADTSDAAALDIMESVTMGGEGRKVSRGVKEMQKEAAARWENDTATSLKKITVATEGLKDGTIPKGYDTFQEYFADVKEGMKYYRKLQKEADEGTDAYWKAVENEADIARGAAKVTSNMGAGFRQYQEILGASPKARVVIVQKEIKQIEKQFEKLLKGKEIKPLSPEVTKMLEEAETPVQQAEALEQASIEIWSQIPASLKEKADQWRMTSMLLNPKTHFRNIIGNFLFRPAILIKDALSVPAEKALIKAGKIDPEDATKAFVSRLNAKDREYRDAAKKVWNEYQTLIRRSGGKYFDTVDSKGFLTSRPLEVGRFTAGKEDPNAVQRALDFLAKKNGDALEAEDAFFMKGKFVDSYSKILKARGLDPSKMTDEQMQEVIEDAAQEALRSTYRDASGLANAINKARNYKPNASAGKKLVGWAVDATLPFVKTPVNILRRAKDYSPVGFIEGAANLTKALSKGDSKAAVEALDRVASGLTGGGICALGLFLGQMGLLDSKLEDGSEGFYKQDLGYQNYSLKLGGDDGVSISLSWAAPLSIPLFTGVEYAKMRENGLSLKDWVKFVDVAGRIFDPTMEMSVMQGPMALLEAISDGENGGDKILKGGLSVGLNYVGQYYPTISGQVARTVDPVRRNTSSTADSTTGRSLEKWKNKQIAKTPFLSRTLEPYVNVWGEEQKTTDNVLLRAAYEFGSPAYVNKIKADEVDKEIIRLNKAAASDDDKIIPSKYFSNAISFDGGKVSLEAKDLTMYNKIKGKASKEAIRKLIKTDEYKDANNDGKREMINKVMKNASTEAKQKTLISKGKDEWKVYTEGFTGGWEEQADAARDAGIKAEQYYKLKTDDSVDLDENGAKSQYEVYTYLEGTDLTKSQKSAMWNAYNKGWKNNPYAGGDIPEAPDPDEVELKQAKKEAEILSKAKERKEGSLAAKAFKSSVMKKATETASLLEDSGSSKGSGSGKRSRGGRRGGGSSKGSKRKATASEKKFARRSSKLSSVDLEKIYEQTKIKPTKLSSVDLAKIYAQVQKANKAKTPTYKDINAKGLTKAQKNALLKIMMKKIQ